MIDLEIIASELYPRPGAEDMIALAVNVTDGETSIMHKFVFPADTPEWRIAEYGLDGWTTDELVELILMEHFMPQVPEDHPFTLFNAPSREQAGAFHLARLEGAKRSALRVTKPAPALRARALNIDVAEVDPTDPMDLVREKCAVDWEIVDIKRQMVEKKRANMGRGGAQMDRLARYQLLLEREASRDGDVHD